MKRLVSFLLLLLTLASCESDVITTDRSIEHTLLLNPPHLEGELYKQYTLKAKITNIPVSDLYFLWDLDEGGGFSHSGWIIHPTFYEPKVHQVRVKVFEGFTDSLLVFDSIRVDIRPPGALVDIQPDAIDTTTLSDLSGNVGMSIKFNVKTSSPICRVRTMWNFGDGSEVVSIRESALCSHIYAKPGTYTVVVNAYDTTAGVHLGSDTTSVRIRLRPSTMLELSVASLISAFLVVDSTHPVTAHPFFKNPFAMAIPTTIIPGDTLEEATFTTGTNDLRGTYRYKSRSTTLHPKLKFDTIACSFADDFRLIKEATVIANDTGFLIYPNSILPGSQRYRYVLKDLELVVSTAKSTVYRSRLVPVAEFVSTLEFDATTFKSHPTGSLNALMQVNLSPGMHAMIQIDR